MAVCEHSSSQEEFTRLRQKYLSSFYTLDKNRDGYITINEITAMFGTMGLLPCESKVRRMLHNAPLQRYGKFIIAMERVERRGDVEQEVQAAFSLGNGELSCSAARSLRCCLACCSAKRLGVPSSPPRLLGEKEEGRPTSWRYIRRTPNSPPVP